MADDGTVTVALDEMLHEASLDPRAWSMALRAVASHVAGDGTRALAALTFTDDRSPHGWMLHSAEPDDERPVFFDRDGRHPLFSLDRAHPEGFVGPSERFAPPDELARTTLARTWLDESGTVRGLSAVITADATFVGSLHLLARRGSPAWRDDADARMRALLPALRRAVRVYARLRRTRALAAVDTALLDSLDVATLVIDHDGRLLRSNLAARMLLARNDGLTDAGGVVRCTRDASELAFAKARAELRAGDDDTRAVVAARTSGRRPLLMLLSRLPAREAWGSTVYTLLVRDPTQQGAHTEELLRELFKLTAAEARLALAIADGQSPAQAAQTLGCSVETVRTHLKRIFEKASITRQAELVRLVLGELPPQFLA